MPGVRPCWERGNLLSRQISLSLPYRSEVPDVDSHTANCLDLLFTTDPDRYLVAFSAPLSTSDHCLKSVPVYSPTENRLVVREGCGYTGQQTGMRCVTSSHSMLGKGFAYIQKIRRAVLKLLPQ